LKGSLLLGDKAYDSRKFIEFVLLTWLKPYVRLREGFGREIRLKVRLKCKGLLKTEGIYRFRGLIESIFGEIKQNVGSCKRTKSFHIAQLFVLAKFIFFNLGGSLFSVVDFSNTLTSIGLIA